MGHSYVNNYVHIVFSTKYRKPLIGTDVEEELFNYLGGICNNLDCQVVRVGGYANHVHILCRLSPKIALSKLVCDLKAYSSKWIKSKGGIYRIFYWQTGYGAFSVYPAEIDVVIRYIENQKAHHQRRKFEEEYLEFLKENAVDYDERYVWD